MYVIMLLSDFIVVKIFSHHALENFFLAKEGHKNAQLDKFAHWSIIDFTVSVLCMHHIEWFAKSAYLIVKLLTDKNYQN